MPRSRQTGRTGSAVETWGGPPHEASRQRAHDSDQPLTAPYAFADASLLLFSRDGRRRYRLAQRIGEGGTGTVYQAKEQTSGQTVAIKLLRDELRLPAPERQRLRARFLRETTLCQRLAHPHVVTILDQGETTHGQLFAVFEHVAGYSLHERLARDGPLSSAHALQLMRQVLTGLNAAHQQGIVHRDLKPRNLMVSEWHGQLHAKILDFGISALMPDCRTDSDLTLTRSGELLGSPRYCSPEQLRNEPPTPRSDLYAWALVLIECLTGKALMPGRSVAEILSRQLSPRDIALPPQIAALPFAPLLRAALRKNPQQRAPSAAMLLQRLDALPPSAYDAVLLPPGMPRLGPRRLASNDNADSAALCCRLSPSLSHPEDRHRLDSWLARCEQLAEQYGAQARGRLDDVILFTFEAQPTPGLAAARAALAIARDCARHCRCALAIHCGPHHTQARTTPRHAIALQRITPDGQILLSQRAYQTLRPEIIAIQTPYLLTTDNGHPASAVYRLLAEVAAQAATSSA